MSNIVNAQMRDLSDEALVAGAQEGRVEAFMELARRFQERIYRTVLGMTRNQEDANDLTQDTFMYAYRAIGSFKQRSSFYTWVYRIAVNLTLNHLKKRSREKGREDYEDNAAVLAKADYASLSPEGGSLRKELRSKLDQAIEALPPAYRATFNLVVSQGLSHGQAAGILGCSENTVSWRMHKARKMLQAGLGPYLDEVRHEMP